ncbi:MAG TPA: hypothetical protein ENN29_04635 [Candidatus Hydrogenedentes bacterium]|nr:hypothetical protein [Candidatus Hydrogenedentota bacterium]
MVARAFLSIVVLIAGASLAEPPNLVLLSVDTLRADFLGCYGCEWDISPRVDQFAETALVFDDATCETPLTGPSFAAMFTSRYPRMVGATRNGMRVADDAPVATELIRNAGYYTFAAQSNWTLRGALCGLDRGFDAYDDSFEQRRWGLYKGERRAEDVTRVAMELLEQRPADKPFFAWIHFSDPHAPYRYRRDFAPAKTSLFNMNRNERVRVKYASEVAYTDHYIGKILEALPENTIVVFVADHGESLYEHGYLGHGRNIHRPSTRVPLMVRAPGVTPGRTGIPVQTLDIAPTLLGLLDIDEHPDMLGCNVLRPEIAADRARFMETYGGAVPKLPGAKQLLRDTPPLHQGVVLCGYKLIRSANRPPELFFLPDDPDEKHNLVAHKKERYAMLNKLIDFWDETHPRGSDNTTALTEEDIEALQSLGYIE